MVNLDIANWEPFLALVEAHRADQIIHLAAQVGVRYSIENPFAYQHSNLAGHLSVLEACRHSNTIKSLVYASSSSVYGDRIKQRPVKECDSADEPVSLYAATKRSCELMSKAYSKLYGLRQSGLRFFTVYGPCGRPDMAYFSFTKRILEGEPIEVYGNGNMARDFTYIDDIVDGVIRVLDSPSNDAEARISNIGDSRPIELMRMINILEDATGREARKLYKPMQAGDVSTTFSDISRLSALTGYSPKVNIEEGLPKFVEWFQQTRTAQSTI